MQLHKIYAPDLRISEERIRWMQALNVEVGSQKMIMPVERVADMSLARDAVMMVGGLTSRNRGCRVPSTVAERPSCNAKAAPS